MRTHPQTHAITLVCANRTRIFQRTTNAELFLATLFRYRIERRFLLHGFVVMPDHAHLLISPANALEQAVGMLKGGTSFTLRKQYKGPIWQDGYYAHRIRDLADYTGQQQYIANNPERRRYADYPHVHTRHLNKLDPIPDHLSG